MYYTTSRIPATFSNGKKHASAIQRVHQASERDGEKLSPVDLSIREAIAIQLPPLCWTHYQVTPTSMTVRNSGFTVMVTAAYDQEAPYVSSGPLMGKYAFSQVHFHWGEHNQTGSGHAADGLRYPLEMHVVHLKRDCATVGEALQSENGIAVMVHLFALRKERNMQLDQLTAILQFIQQSRCCARLCPTPLSEIVQPFTSDYFLYWGAVGSPQGQYRILWLVSRKVLPVSIHQLEEFRQLRDTEGQVLETNSSRPQPLSGRSLFLVSPSERTNETMCGVSRKPTLESQQSIDIRNAEYRSLADLENGHYDDCRVCHPAKRLQHTANINVGYPFKVNEGDTSVEESCIDLYDDKDNSGVTVETKMKYKDNSKGQKLITNVNVTACRHKCQSKPDPSEAVYTVVSTRGSELHLKRKPMFVRQNDPSTEQACMLLNTYTPTRTTCSAPSLSTSCGFLTNKQEHTNLSNPPITNMSSEVAVHYMDSDPNIQRNHQAIRPVPYHPSMNEYEKKTNFEETQKTSKHTKKVRIMLFEDRTNIHNKPPKEGESSSQQMSVIPKNDTNIIQDGQKKYISSNCDEFYEEEEEENILKNEERAQFLLLKQTRGKKPFYKIVGETPATEDPLARKNNKMVNIQSSADKNYYYNNKLINQERDLSKNGYENKKILIPTSNLNPSVNEDISKTNYEEFYEDTFYTENERKEKFRKQIISKKNVPFQPQCPPQQPEDCQSKKPKEQQPGRDKTSQDTKTHVTPHYRVNLLVRATVSDHRGSGKKKEAQKYIVTKISPIEKSSYITPKSSEHDISKCYGKKPDKIEHFYYAKPIHEDEQKKVPKDRITPEERLVVGNNTADEGYTHEYYEESLEDLYKKHREEEHLNIRVIQDERHKDPAGTKSQETEKPKTIEKSVYEEEVLQSQQIDHHQQETIHKKTNTNYSQKPHPQETVSKKNITPEIKSKELCQTTIERKSEEIDECENKNLQQRVTVYHGKKDTEEDVFVIDKTIAGKVGKSQSTDVFVTGKHTETVSPQKTDVLKEINYDLVKSKHPEPQYYVKEPLSKAQPATVIRQHLSLDQQIKGRTQVRQTVEYHDNRDIKTTNIVPGREPMPKDESNEKESGFTGVTKTYEESSREQSSTVQKSQHHAFKTSHSAAQNIKPIKGNDQIDPKRIEKEKSDVLRLSNVDPKLMIPTAHLAPLMGPSSGGQSIERLNAQNKACSNKDPFDVVTAGDPPTVHELDPPNIGVSSYENTEINIENKHFEHSQHEKRVTYEKHGEADRSFKELVDPNRSLANNLPDSQPPSAVVENNKPIINKQIIQRENETPIKSYPDVINDEEVEYEECLEENVVHTTQRTEKMRKQVRGETAYKLPSQHPEAIGKPASQHVITIKKTDIPEPHYVTRVPKQPLVEYEAYPVDPHQPFEIISETSEEVTTVVKTNKTFMMFKKINGKAVLNQPSIIEPMKVENNKNRSLQQSEQCTKPKKSSFSEGQRQLQKLEPSSANTQKDEIKVWDLYESLNKEEQNKLIQNQQTRIFKTNNLDPIGHLPEKVEAIEGTITKVPHDDLIQLREASVKTPQLTTPTRAKGPNRMLTEYHYSETSLTSEKRFIQKEKRIKFTTHQTPMFEEDHSKMLGNNQIKDISSNKELPKSTIAKTNQQNITDSSTQLTNLEKNLMDNKTKIVLGSHQKQNNLVGKSECTKSAGKSIYGVEMESPVQSILPLKTDIPYTGVGQFTNEEFYENIIKDQKYESTKKRVFTTTGIDPSTLYSPNLSESHNMPNIRDKMYPKIQDKPTKEWQFRGHTSQIADFKNQPMSETQDSLIRKPYLYQTVNDKGHPSMAETPSPHITPNVTSNTVPITKTDGDIVIYIRQPRTKKQHVSPKITVDVTESHLMTPSELESQKVQVHGVNRKGTTYAGKPILPKKSKSAEFYRPSPSTEDSEDETENHMSSASNEEQIIDTTHYNLTLKSETKVGGLSGGQKARVKSRAEVTITPQTQATMPSPGPKTPMDECCSKVDITEIQDSDGYYLSSSQDGASKVDSSKFNQSPIRIDTQSSVVQTYAKLNFINHWNIQGDALLENNGKTLRVTLLPDTPLPYIQGGPLMGDYIFSELHFHWGRKDCCGAEHIIDGHRNTIEAHYLYFKKDYETLKNAVNYTDGVAIVAVYLNVGGPPNSLFAVLVRDMPLLREAETGTYVPAESLFSWIRPVITAAKGYFSYKGMMTTAPPYVEAVTWFIFPEPIVFCCQQSKEFRMLKSANGELLTKNFRPPQPLNNRAVYYVPL